MNIKYYDNFISEFDVLSVLILLTLMLLSPGTITLMRSKFLVSFSTMVWRSREGTLLRYWNPTRSWLNFYRLFWHVALLPLFVDILYILPTEASMQARVHFLMAVLVPFLRKHSTSIIMWIIFSDFFVL